MIIVGYGIPGDSGAQGKIRMDAEMYFKARWHAVSRPELPMGYPLGWRSVGSERLDADTTSLLLRELVYRYRVARRTTTKPRSTIRAKL
jgi:hypothetical protein